MADQPGWQRAAAYRLRKTWRINGKHPERLFVGRTLVKLATYVRAGGWDYLSPEEQEQLSAGMIAGIKLSSFTTREAVEVHHILTVLVQHQPTVDALRLAEEFAVFRSPKQTGAEGYGKQDFDNTLWLPSNPWTLLYVMGIDPQHLIYSHTLLYLYAKLVNDVAHHYQNLPKGNWRVSWIFQRKTDALLLLLRHHPDHTLLYPDRVMGWMWVVSVGARDSGLHIGVADVPNEIVIAHTETSEIEQARNDV